MRTTKHLKQLVITGILAIFMLPLTCWSQSNRIKPPKRVSKVESADIFVNKSFELYDKVFVYDSLTVAGVDIPVDLEDELFNSAKLDFDQLVEVSPEVVDDISNASFLKQAKAVLNLEKAKKALVFCGETIKGYFIEEE